MSTIISIIVIASSVFYPLLLLISWRFNDKVSIMEVLKFINSAEVPRKLNILMIEEYKILVFAPNIIGAITAIVEKGYFDFEAITDEIKIGLLISHFSLLVIATTGQAFLRLAVKRVLPFFIGEILYEWALVGGTFLFVVHIAQFQVVTGSALPLMLTAVITSFLITYIWFRMGESAESYADGAYKESHPEPPAPAPPKYEGLAS